MRAARASPAAPAPAPWMGDARGESQHAHRLLRRSRPLDGRCAWRVSARAPPAAPLPPLDGRCAWRVSARASPAAPLPPPGWAMRVASLSTRIACCAAPAPWMGDARGESQHAHRLLRRSRPLDGRCAWRVSARASPAAPLPPPDGRCAWRVSARASPARRSAPWMGDARGESQHAHRLLRRSRPWMGDARGESQHAHRLLRAPAPGWAMRVASLSTRIAACAAPARVQRYGTQHTQCAYVLLRITRRSAA